MTWDRYQRANSDKSSVVLARTRAEVRALSHLMRERGSPRCRMQNGRYPPGRYGPGNGDGKQGAEDERAASPLEIARGDRLRIGATHWEKQLFNGTVVTVEDFKVERSEAGTAPSVLISARTGDGREVRFHHDEIRDWYGNIRLDHGYAMTITSAQGLTVDRTFLLADTRPSRETIYPAATRHRERLDIYVNRAPLALDIANRRADNDREVAVTDTGIRAGWPNAGRARNRRKQHSTIWPMAYGKTGESMSRRTGFGPLAKPRARLGISVRRQTTTLWPVLRGMSGAPPSAGVTPRRLPPSPTAASRFWRRMTISANRPA